MWVHVTLGQMILRAEAAVRLTIVLGRHVMRR